MKRFWWVVAALVLVLMIAALWPWLRTDPDPSDPVAIDAPVVPDPVALVEPEPPAAPTAPQESVKQVVTESGIPLRIVQRVPLARPVPPYGPAYEGLLTQAQAGDKPAQYRLGLLLYECRDVPEDEAALRAEVETVHQTRRHGIWDVSDPESEAADLNRRYADCAGVPAKARGEYRDWIKAAADGGLIEAQLDVMYHLPQREFCQYLWQCTPEQRRRQEALQAESLHYVTLAREAGSAAALWTFGAWYQGDEVMPRDDIQAFAYYRALDQINAAAGVERRFTAMLAGLSQKLRPIDREQAEAQAAEILRNPRCCVLTR